MSTPAFQGTETKALDVVWVREQFPSLQRTVNGHPAAFLDGPAGTQVPKQVMDAVHNYWMSANANTCGAFETSRRNDAMIAATRAAMADFFHCDADEVVFGQNMTTITFALSRAIAHELNAGDEIVVTTLDHDANVAPWRALEEKGVVIRQVDIREDDCTLDLDDLRHKIIEIEGAIVFANVCLTDDYAFLFEGAPRGDVGVVVQCGDYNFIASVQFVSDGTREREGDRGHVLTEDNFVGVAVKEVSHGGAGGCDHRVVAPAGFEGAASVGVRAHPIIVNRIHHLLGHLRSRGAIEKSCRMSVHGPLQRRELFAYPHDVECFRFCSLECRCAHRVSEPLTVTIF